MVEHIVSLFLDRIDEILVFDRNQLDSFDAHIAQARQFVHRFNHVSDFVQSPRERVEFAEDVVLAVHRQTDRHEITAD